MIEWLIALDWIGWAANLNRSQSFSVERHGRGDDKRGTNMEKIALQWVCVPSSR